MRADIALPPVAAGRRRTQGLAPAFQATRAQLGLVALLIALAVASWWWTAGQMRGMDNGPWTDLGSLGWFVGVWAVMMAAMMLPSVVPTVALYAQMAKGRSPLAPFVFSAGYLVAWVAVGLLAFVVADGVGRMTGDILAWNHAGRWLAGGTLVAAALYELTPLKDACLRKCRTPVGFLMGSWRPGWIGGLTMGVESGVWCIGCCWALMASLFALGIMSVGWMALVAALIAAEKLVPWQRVATYGTAVILLAIGLLLLTAPDAIPGLTIPAHAPMSGMGAMGQMGM